MPNDKDQMTNEAQSSNDKREGVLVFKHLDFVWNLDFGIWNLVNGIATPRQVGARNDILFRLCEGRSPEAISVGLAWA
jgi:hypothetical protein